MIKIFIVAALFIAANTSALDLGSILGNTPGKTQGELSMSLNELQQLQRAVLENKDRKALERIQDLAKNRNPVALNFIGYLYDNGAGGLPRNSLTAARYFKAGAQLGDYESLHNLAILFLNGRGVPADQNAALQMLKTAATNGRVPASFVVLGIQAEKNKRPDEAAGWYSQVAANYSHIFATVRYGLMMMKGYGAPRDHKRAMVLLEAAANVWDPDAQWAMAELRAGGIGIPRNEQEAAKWYFIAQANPEATAYRSKSPQILGFEINTQEKVDHAKGAAGIWISSHATYLPRRDYTKTIFLDMDKVIPLARQVQPITY